MVKCIVSVECLVFRCELYHQVRQRPPANARVLDTYMRVLDTPIRVLDTHMRVLRIPGRVICTHTRVLDTRMRVLNTGRRLSCQSRVSCATRLSSNPSGKCSYERPTRGRVCGTMRSMCGADAGCSAINYQPLSLCASTCQIIADRL